MKDATSELSKGRGRYCHVDTETFEIAQYACEHGDKADMERFSTLLGFDIKKCSSVVTIYLLYMRVRDAIAFQCLTENLKSKILF